MADNETRRTSASERARQQGGNANEAQRVGDLMEHSTRETQDQAQHLRHLGEEATDTFRRSMEGRLEDAMLTMNELFRSSTKQWRSLMQVPQNAGNGIQDIQREFGGAAERIMHNNLRAAQELVHSGTAWRMAQFQQQIVRNCFEAMLESSTNMFRAMRKTTEQTMRPFEGSSARGSFGERCVADIMRRDVHLASPEDTVQQAARLMREADTGSLPVGEGDRLVGMVTDRDVAVRLAAEGRDPARTKVRDVMSPEVRYVFEDENLEHVADNMAEQQVRRLPVMNRQKRLVGVVSIADIAKAAKPQVAGGALGGITREGGEHQQAAE